MVDFLHLTVFLTSIDYNKDPDADSAFYYNAYPDLGRIIDADPCGSRS